MSPERAKVFVAEDDKKWQDMIKDILAADGHQVVLSATNLKDALAATNRLEELKVDVAIIDGNLNELDTSGDDGRAVLAAIRAAAPEVKTIGLSGSGIKGVDVNLGKALVVDLAKTVKRL